MQIRKELLKVLDRLDTSLTLENGWPGGDWPVGREFQPFEFEIVVGAILTQNTQWKNVETVLSRLVDAGLTSAERISRCQSPILEGTIRSARFFRQKSAVLKSLAGAILESGDSFYSRVSRDRLLQVSGVGPETADAILLYACGRCEFVADSYARRFLRRYGFLEDVTYQKAKDFFETHLPADVKVYRRSHALLVEHGKALCRSVPFCQGCLLQKECKSANQSLSERPRTPGL